MNPEGGVPGNAALLSLFAQARADYGRREAFRRQGREGHEHFVQLTK